MPLILVIEDDTTQRTAIVLTLSAAGHIVLEASDGYVGLEMAKAHKPDLIVSDVVMQGIDGHEVIRALRRQEEAIYTPVILLTALSDYKNIREGMVTGADDYLIKPFVAQDLCNAVAATLAKHAGQRASVLHSAQRAFANTLMEQHQQLAQQYEKRLLKELNVRWSKGKPDSPLLYHDVGLLLVDIFGSNLNEKQFTTEQGDQLLRMYKSARDILYLFGARHLIPYGNNLLAIYISELDADTVGVDVRAIKAAFGILKMAQSIKGMAASVPEQKKTAATIAYHRGDISLMHIDDPLHGDPYSHITAGRSVAETAGLRDFAMSSHWPIICSTAAKTQLKNSVVVGRRANANLLPGRPTAECFELLALS